MPDIFDPPKEKRRYTKRKKKEENTEGPSVDLPEDQEFIEVLKASFYTTDERTKLDRYREFRSVFLGSDEGKRVLYEIMALAKLSAPLVEPYPAPIDVERMLIREGGRQLVLNIIRTISKEPNMDRPTKTVNRVEKD